MVEGSGDTICAVASPAGGAERAVVRVSGPAAADVAARVLASDASALGERERRAFDARVAIGDGSLPALVLWMPGPRSYTGEDVVEFHVPGAVPLVDSIVASLLRSGARPARAGEFTRRAFESGRIDLARAEGVAELTAARGEDERRAALALLLGGLSDRVDALRDRLEELCSLCEASLDFDESDAGHVSKAEIVERTEASIARLDDAAAWEASRPRRTSSRVVVLVGPPNAGKSTLFNRLARASALTSPVAGTTRDALSATVEHGGTTLELVDLPGFGPAADELDARAQALAAAQLARADAVVLVLDASTPDRDPGDALRRAPLEPVRVLAWNQVDRPEAAPPPPADRCTALGVRVVVSTSGATGAGAEALLDAVSDALAEAGEGAGSLSLEVAGRHRQGFLEARVGLERARETAAAGWPLDVVATELRGALSALDAVTGRTGAEDLLDRIFARFCLGK
ncbi:MAG: GTPase [Planctomycetota bacterium]